MLVEWVVFSFAVAAGLHVAEMPAPISTAKNSHSIIAPDAARITFPPPATELRESDKEPVGILLMPSQFLCAGLLKHSGLGNRLALQVLTAKLIDSHTRLVEE